MKKIKITFCCAIIAFQVSAKQTNYDQHTPPKPEEVMQDMDINKDGKISKEEAKGPIVDDFKKIDLNKDGFITLVELKKAPKPPKQNPPSR